VPRRFGEKEENFFDRMNRIKEDGTRDEVARKIDVKREVTVT